MKDLRRKVLLVIPLLLLLVIPTSVLMLNNSTVNISGKKQFIIQYKITALGEPSFGKHTIKTTYQDLKELINTTINPKEINFLVTIHRDYNELLKNFMKNKGISLLEELSKVCFILSKDLMFVIKGVKESNTLSANVSLIFEKGIAKCGKNFGSLPKIDTKWTFNGEYYLSEFNYLNLSKEIKVNLKTLNVFDDQGEWLGDWILEIPKDYLSNKSYVALVYGINELINVKFNADVNFSGAASLLILNTEGGNLSQAGYTCEVNGKVFKALPQERVFWGVEKGKVNSLINLIKRKMGKVLNSCGIRDIPFSYDEVLKKLTIFKDVILSNAGKVNGVWSYVHNIFSDCEVMEFSNKQIKYCFTYSGIQYLNKYYIAHPLTFGTYFEYGDDGILKTAKFEVQGAHITDSLPGFIVKLFNLFNSHTSKSEIIIKLVTYQ